MKLRSLSIAPIFVLDGDWVPEKAPEHAHRAARRLNLQAMVEALTAQLEEYKLNKTLGPELTKLSQSSPRYIRKLDEGLNVYTVQTQIDKLTREVLPIPPSVKVMFRKICKAFHIPIIVAQNDGEMLCAKLTRLGLADVVYSHDSDVFPAGATHVIRELDGVTAKCLSLQEILDSSELELPAFKDMCILCGTDYNKRVAGLGPITAYNLLKQYGTLEEVAASTGKDLTIVNYERVREIYEHDTIELPPYTAPDRPEIFGIVREFKLYNVWPEMIRLWGFSNTPDVKAI